jgi:hypothetical protein
MRMVQVADDESFVEAMLLDGLEPSVMNLFARIRTLGSGIALMRFLDANANTFLTTSDIAWLIQKPHREVEKTMDVLTEMGLAQKTSVAGLNLYSITTDPIRRKQIHAFCEWQNQWHTRSEQIKNFLHGIDAESRA